MTATEEERRLCEPEGELLKASQGLVWGLGGKAKAGNPEDRSGV